MDSPTILAAKAAFAIHSARWANARDTEERTAEHQIMQTLDSILDGVLKERAKS